MVGLPIPSTSAPRSVLRSTLTVLAVVGSLYLLYLLRKPLSWLVIATFLAIALSGPVNVLSRRMKRGLAILIVYLVLILTPVGLSMVIFPPLVSQATKLVQKAPQYSSDLNDFIEKNQTLKKLNTKYDITGEIQKQANRLPSRVGDAAKVLSSIGLGLLNSAFAGLTILILSVFMVGGGRGWITKIIELQSDREHAQRLERTVDRVAVAVGNYVAGALLQATVAGVTTFAVLKILGVPFAAPLAVVTALFDLLPMVGATIAAVLVGLVTVFNDFPTDTIIWVIWAVSYQQLENNVVQPRIQSKATDIHPFLVIVSVLFGATLFGVLGALLAVPVAASIQIGVREWWSYRQGERAGQIGEAPT